MDYETEFDEQCPKCKAWGINYRDCSNFQCQDGMVDENDDDPINFMPGEVMIACKECNGSGVERWCRNCGQNLSGLTQYQQMQLYYWKIRKLMTLKRKRKKTKK